MSENKFHAEQARIGIIGLGYVGLPLAVAFAEKYTVVGLDINGYRVEELRKGIDRTLEVDQQALEAVLMTPDKSQVTGLFCTTNIQDLTACNVYIVTVPTPTDRYNRPVLTPMIKASQGIGTILKRGDVVVYESTVYPGVTEEEMVPVLEQTSGLSYNKDFYCGYSPERINPGDKEHTVTNIIKVTSGSTPAVAEFVDTLYRSVIMAGTHRASSIRVAEATKVIENSQRDINIAFVNELSKIFNRMGIDTQEVLEAAGTKWNFLKFKPGLVGGHCIGVDPYYLAQKAQEVGYHPEIILAGRRLNDSMGAYVAEEVVKRMLKADLRVKDARCLVLGFTFKENCPDYLNTRVIDIIRELDSYGMQVIIHDPWVKSEEVAHEYKGLVVNSTLPQGAYDAVVLAVAHREFENQDLRALAPKGLVFDVKGLLPKGASDWRL